MSVVIAVVLFFLGVILCGCGRVIGIPTVAAAIPVLLWI